MGNYVLRYVIYVTVEHKSTLVLYDLTTLIMLVTTLLLSVVHTMFFHYVRVFLYWELDYVLKIHVVSEPIIVTYTVEAKFMAYVKATIIVYIDPKVANKKG